MRCFLIGCHLVLRTTGLGSEYKIFPGPGGIFVAKTEASVSLQMKFSLAALLLLAVGIAAHGGRKNKYDEFAKNPAKYLKRVANAGDGVVAMEKLLKDCGALIPDKEVDQTKASKFYNAINTYLATAANVRRDELFQAALPMFGRNLDKLKLPSEVTRRLKADPTNIKRLLSFLLLTKRDAAKISFKNVPVDLILAGGSDAFVALQGGFGLNKPILHLDHEHLWRAFFSMADTQTYTQMCSTLSVATLERLNETTTKMFKPDCIAHTDLGISTGVTISRFPADVFALYDKEIGKTVAGAMTGPQVAAIGTRLKNESTRCRVVSVPEMSNTAVNSATLACIMSYLAKSDNPSLEKKWSYLNTAVFDGLAAIREKAVLAMLANRLNDEDWYNMNKSLQSKLLSIAELAKNIPESVVFKRTSDVRLEGRALAQVKNSQIIAMAIGTKDPPTDIFAYFTADDVRSWDIKGRHGLAVLDILDTTDPETKKKIIEAISTKIEPGQEHACASITTIEEYNAIKIFKTHQPSKTCLKAMKLDLDQAAAKKHNELLAATPYSKIMEIFGKDGLKTITGEQFGAVIKNDFCSQVDQEVFEIVNKDALYVIDQRCVQLLIGRFPLKADRTTRFGDKAFASITATQFAAHLGFAHISDKQLSHLSTVVAVKESVFANVEPAVIAGLSSRIRHLSSKQVASMKDATLASLDIKNLTPASLTDLSPEQISRLVSKFGSLSPEQVQKIGANYADQKAVAAVLRQSANLLSTACRAALDARFPSPKSSASYVAPSAIAIGVAAVVAGAFLF